MRKKIPFNIFFEFGAMTVMQELPGKGRKLQPLRFIFLTHCFGWKLSADSFTRYMISCLLVWERKQQACPFPRRMRWQCFCSVDQIYRSLSGSGSGWFGNAPSICGYLRFRHSLTSSPSYLSQIFKSDFQRQNSSEKQNRVDTRWCQERGSKLGAVLLN